MKYEKPKRSDWSAARFSVRSSVNVKHFFLHAYWALFNEWLLKMHFLFIHKFAVKTISNNFHLHDFKFEVIFEVHRGCFRCEIGRMQNGIVRPLNACFILRSSFQRFSIMNKLNVSNSVHLLSDLLYLLASDLWIPIRAHRTYSLPELMLLYLYYYYFAWIRE